MKVTKFISDYLLDEMKAKLVAFSFFFFFQFFFFWLHWVFIAAQAFSSCSKRGLLFVAVCGLLNAVASFVAEHGL